MTSKQRKTRRLEAARGYLALDMPHQALRELRAIREAGDGMFDWHSLRGEALRQLAEFDEALAEFRRAAEAAPGDIGVLLGMAWCYKRTDRLSNAIEAMHRAYDAAPKEPVVLYNLACYYALDDNKVDALSWLGRALRLDAGLTRLIPEESDFDSLRHDDDFRFIVDSVATRA